MPTPTTDPKEQHTGIWRFPPFRLLRWIDNQGSPALTKLLVGLMLVVICWVASFFWQQIVAWIPFLGRLVASLRTEFLLELWMLILWMLVPLVGLVWFRRRRLVIHKADWHTDAQHHSDKTDYFRKENARGVLRVPAKVEVLGDPHQHTVKTLTVDYSVRGRRKQKTVQEHEVIELD